MVPLVFCPWQLKDLVREGALKLSDHNDQDAKKYFGQR